eukprot:1564988-Amphidinium_carterae.1
MGKEQGTPRMGVETSRTQSDAETMRASVIVLRWLRNFKAEFAQNSRDNMTRRAGIGGHMVSIRHCIHMTESNKC